MLIPQKVQYSLRALFELAKREGSGSIKIAEIASSQAIPMKFLEVLLSQLKQGGFVESKRGAEGGYQLARPAEKISVGDLIKFMQGGFEPVTCISGGSKDNCSLYGECVFLSFWEEINNAVSNICDKTSLRDLINREKENREKKFINFEI